MFAQLERRRTYRKRFEKRGVDEPARAALVDAVEAEGAGLQALFDDADREAVAVLVAEGDAVQWGDRDWRRELAAWMRPRSKGDGLAVPGVVGPVVQLVARSFDIGKGVGAKDRELAEVSPLLAVLTTEVLERPKTTRPAATGGVPRSSNAASIAVDAMVEPLAARDAVPGDGVV